MNFLLLTLILFSSAAAAAAPDRFFRSSTLSQSNRRKRQQYLELSRPLPSDRLSPACSLPVIHHSFGNTINRPPFSAPYSPPSSPCSSPWSHVSLLFRASSKGDQYDRVSAVWLGGAELLRTSTAEPTKDGIFWEVRKDITRYSSLLKRENLNFTIMLENVVNNVYTGVYHVRVTLLFYKDDTVRIPFVGINNIRILSGEIGAQRLHESSPAELIIPISSSDGVKRGFWFRIERESDVHMRKVRFPENTHKAVLELYVSFHGNDEFWYSNPPNDYIKINNLSTLRGNGAYREAFVTIDGMVVGSEVPFPVVFTGGINPLFWEPVVGIGAFNLPSYDFDLSPFLGMVLDGKDHVIGVGVSDGISFWLVDANLHIWLDGTSSIVEAKSVVYDHPQFSINRAEEFRMLDGSFGIKGGKKMRLVGWVKSSLGNLTTSVMKEIKFRNSIRFAKNGTFKYVKQKIKAKTEVKVKNDVGGLLSRVIVKRKHPLKVITATLPGLKKDTYVLVTNVSRALQEKHVSGKFSSSVHNVQVSNGWMEVKDHSVLSGQAITNQTLSCRDQFGCYVRTVVAINGRLIADNATYVCPSVM